VKTLMRLVDIAVYLVFLAFAIVVGPHTAAWYVGLFLAAVSVPWWFLARWQLGAAFSVTAQAHRLVTSGVYSRFRHPVYVFGSVGWLGALMVLLGWKAVLIWAGIVLMEFFRARREERVLEETFGAEYAAYRDRTWF